MRPRFLAVLHSSFLLLLIYSVLNFTPTARSQAAAVWGTKPVLAHYLLIPEVTAQLKNDINLTEPQLQHILEIAQQENLHIQNLEAESSIIVDDPNLTREQKSAWVIHSGYNEKLHSILIGNQQKLRQDLGEAIYQKLVDWIEERWAQESQQFRHPVEGFKALPMLAQKTYPRSFEVYATRYDAGDRKIVALPDKCLKFANGGAMQCPGYAYGMGYSVAISYKGNLVVALVGESGPWNVDDNYWAKSSDPQPRRKFTDLGLGVPEAQAAYFNGYNGGVDQFGRTVTSPVAIDVSKALAADLGLGPGNNQVTVTFLWTDGWDAPQAKSGQGNAQNPGTQAAPIAPVTGWEVATPAADGSITHTVKSGQTLVGIATVYRIPLADLLSLNGLNMQSIIQPGDKIIVKRAESTSTSAATATMPASSPTHIRVTRTPLPTTATPTTTIAITATQEATALAVPTNSFSPRQAILPGIIVVGLAGIALVVWGLLTRRNQ